MITFQICSVLSSKLNSPAYLQENKCTSYCLLESASWAVWVFLFQWACCDFVLTDWSVFHFAFIFHPVRRILSAFFSLPLPLAVCMDQCTEAVTPSPLHCWFAASRAIEAWAEPSLWEARVKPWPSRWAASSAVGRMCRRGGRGRWTSKWECLRQSESFLYFSLDLCCVSPDPPRGAAQLGLDHLLCLRSAVHAHSALVWRGCRTVAVPSCRGWFAEVDVCKGLGVWLPLLPSAEWHPFMSPLAVTVIISGGFMPVFWSVAMLEESCCVITRIIRKWEGSHQTHLNTAMLKLSWCWEV